MIEKLFKLKNTQIDQKLIEKGQIVVNISLIEDEIMFTENKIKTTSVEKHGAISDFFILEIHKKTMKSHIAKLEAKKIRLKNQLDNINDELVLLQKESEQYKYILEEEKQEVFRKVLSLEEEASSEFIQSKYING